MFGRRHGKSIEKLQLQNRKATFKTVIALIINGQEYFRRKSERLYSTKKTGEDGFGYDLFQPWGLKSHLLK